ncbi:MAG: transcriptional regulator [Anaerolineaceae bacterium]|nr:transcriptional regulator [Anaerolineaceae bacterium]
MGNVFEEIVGLDKLIHEPARLAIMTILSTVESADFLALQRLTGLTSGNLSVHLSKLEEGKFVTYDRKIVGKKTKTQVKITSEGQQALEKHWLQLETFREKVKETKSD